MSHFIVIVAVSGDLPLEDVEDVVSVVLQPFHEFECTGHDDQFVQDVDITEHARAQWLSRGKNEEGQTFVEWVHGYHGLKAVPFGEEPDKAGPHKYGWVRVDAAGEVTEAIDRTNPNKKWDWWQIGGRWAGYFRTKEGAQTFRGDAGLAGSRKSPAGADVVRKRDVDYEAEAREVSAEAGAYYDRVYAVVAPHLDGFRTWDDVRTSIPRDLDEARRCYHGQPACRALRAASATDEELAWVELEELLCSREEYIAERVRRARTPLAFVDVSGKWHERCRVGWFASMSNENADWPAEFGREFAKVGDDDWLVAVDCHI